MSFILHLPAELVHHIGGHMLATTYHPTLCILSKSCTFLQTNLYDRLGEARLHNAWEKDWKNALKHMSADQMVILERHQNMGNTNLPPYHDLIDACVQVGNIDVLKYVLMARKAYEKEGDIVRLFLKMSKHGHLIMVQWLALQFNLTKEDARAFDNHALRVSCKYGHLDVARWLTEHFDYID